MNKFYITAQLLLETSFQLAHRVFEDGFRPDVIIGVWRGGTPVGIAVQEYYEYRGVNTDHIAVSTRSYVGIDDQAQQISVHGLHYLLDNSNADSRILIVDDVFDSGRSVKAIFEKLQSKTRRNMPRMKVATPWYKPAKNVTDITPDYFVHETDAWLVFPHELVGLTQQEIIDHKGELATTLTARLKTAS